MSIDGVGRHIDRIMEEYNSGTSGTNVCYLQAKWYGNFTASGWTNYYSSKSTVCNSSVQYTGWYTVGDGYIVNNSRFYGYAQSNLSNGAWSPYASLAITA